MAKRKSREGREQGFMARRAGPSARGRALEAHLPEVGALQRWETHLPESGCN